MKSNSILNVLSFHLTAYTVREVLKMVQLSFTTYNKSEYKESFYPKERLRLDALRDEYRVCDSILLVLRD